MADEIKKISGCGDLIEVDINPSAHNKFLSFLDPGVTFNMTISANRLSISINDPIPALESILGVVREHNIKVDNIRLRKSSLEDIFISLTGRSLRE